MKLKITTIVGTRPEIIRLSRIISEFDSNFDHTLVHTGQNFSYELNEIFFDSMNIRKPDIFLNCANGNETSGEVISNIIRETNHYLIQNRPDAIFLLGDTNSCLSAIAAKKLQIPIFHYEAGNRCFDIRVPEEVNRKLVDHLADINLTYSDISRDYLIKENFPPDQIIKIGSPMREVLEFYKEDINNSKIIDKLALNENKFFLLSFHREENVENDSIFNTFLELIKYLNNNYDMPVVVSTHPRLRKKLSNLSDDIKKFNIFSEPFNFFDYVSLQLKSKLVISDSGTINEESSILGFEALNFRDSFERPEAMEEATVILSGTNISDIKKSVDYIISEKNSNKNISNVYDYSPINVSKKISRIILSYTHFAYRKFRKNIQ